LSQDDTCTAEAINLPQSSAAIILSAQDLAAIIGKLQSLRDDFDALDRDLKQYKVFTKTGQVDDLSEAMASIERRVAKLEGHSACPEKITKNRLAKLDYLLMARNNEPMTFSEIGKILELGSRKNGKNTRRQAMTRFSKNLDNKNYEVFDSNTQSGKMVRLTKLYFTHLKMGAGQV